MGSGEGATGRPAYKYVEHLKQHKKCPKGVSNCVSERVYRFAWDPLCPKSFMPPGIGGNPALPGRPFQCVDYAVSLVQSEEQADQFFGELQGRYQNAKERYGSHLAVVNLEPAHGDRGKTDSAGHFNLFEYVGVDLVAVSTILKPL